MTKDEVKVFVVLKEEESLPPEEIIQWCIHRLADFKIPRYITYQKSLPKTPSQRIAKYLLKQAEAREEVLDMSGYIQKVLRERRNA
jgi:crotonobetaine/carnitine-CoA ligase